MKEIFQNKAAGFWLTLASMVFSLITAGVYAGIYASTRYISWTAVGILVAGVVISALLILAGLHRLAPSLLLLADFLAFLFYVYYIYFFISSVATGIQFSGFPLEFYVNIVVFVIDMALDVVCVYLPQTKQ